MSLDEPMKEPEARQRVARLLEAGKFRVRRHAEERMMQTHLDIGDVTNVLRGGRLARDSAVSFENGTWRYRFETTKIAVVVAFCDEGEAFTVVTAFRLGGSR